MAQQIAVIGLGALGAALARGLSERGAEVIAIDIQKEPVEDLRDLVAVAVTLDATDERALRSLGIENVDTAVVSIGTNVQANLLTATLLKTMGVHHVFARATNRTQERILQAVGVNHVINVEGEMGRMLADRIASPHIELRVPLASGHSVAELKAPGAFTGKTLRELALRRKYGVNLVAIKRRRPEVDEAGRRGFKETVNDIPGADDSLERGDVIVVVGPNDMIDKLPRD